MVVSIAVLLDKANNVSRDEYFVRKRDKANTYVIQYATKSIHKLLLSHKYFSL